MSEVRVLVGTRKGAFVLTSDGQRIYVVPIKSDSEHYPPEGKLRVYRSRTGGIEWEPLTKGLPQSDCYVNVLRDAMAVDSLDSCGIYFGTTGGQRRGEQPAGSAQWAGSTLYFLPPPLYLPSANRGDRI